EPGVRPPDAPVREKLGERRRYFPPREPAKCAIRILEQDATLGLANVHSAHEHGLEHRLELAWRVRNDAQYLRRCRLLFECLGQFLFKIGARLATGTNARSRLRSGRTTFATVRSAFRAFARRGHLNRPHAEDQAFLD